MKLDQTWTWVGFIHGMGWVGSGWVENFQFSAYCPNETFRLVCGLIDARARLCVDNWTRSSLEAV